jgi:hypothetical protein
MHYDGGAAETIIPRDLSLCERATSIMTAASRRDVLFSTHASRTSDEMATSQTEAPQEVPAEH